MFAKTGHLYYQLRRCLSLNAGNWLKLSAPAFSLSKTCLYWKKWLLWQVMAIIRWSGAGKRSKLVSRSVNVILLKLNIALTLIVFRPSNKSWQRVPNFVVAMLFLWPICVSSPKFTTPTASRSIWNSSRKLWRSWIIWTRRQNYLRRIPISSPTQWSESKTVFE